MKCLIINADDYGYTSGVSAGIRRAYREGIVTSTSVMMPMPHARAALHELKAESPSLSVGVHLTLTEGVPFRLAAFPFWKTLGTALAEIPVAALRDEWRAQIEAFLATGLRLTHLDSHHHAAYRHENALAAMLELARQYGVPVRNPYPISGVDAGFADGLFATSGVRYPTYFSDVFDGRTEPGADAFSKALSVLNEGVTEFMVHPGIVDDELRRLCPTFAAPRAQELSALTDPRVRDVARRFGVELVNFTALSQPDGGSDVRMKNPIPMSNVQNEQPASDRRFLIDLRVRPPRSPRARLGPFIILARALDKCRAHLDGVAGEYVFDSMLDRFLFAFKGVTGDEFKGKVASGYSDEEMLQWLRQAGLPRTEPEILAWGADVLRYSLAYDPTGILHATPERVAYLTVQCVKYGLDPLTTPVLERLELDDLRSFEPRNITSKT